MATESKHSAGELLKQSRLRQRLSIAECAKRTHIAPRYIEALEEGKWSVLPSESHRLGFLRLYARFLGVPPEEVLSLYRQKPAPEPAPKTGERRTTKAPSAPEPGVRVKKTPHTTDWSPSSIPQVIGLAILLLIFAWVVYHLLSPRLLEQNQMPWARRSAPNQSRLVTPKSAIASQKVRIKADADSWLRVTTKNELLFEGILPAGSVKEWSGAGPFQFKIGNIRSISLFWNDQPVDITAGANGNTNQLRIPPQ